MRELPPEVFLDAYPAPIVEIANALRAAVRLAVPDALERVRVGWRVVGFDVPNGRRSAFFGWVMPEPAHVHLGFQHGVLMADPGRRLQGAGVTRQVRWLTFRPGDAVEPADLEPFLLEATRVACLGRSARLALALDRDTAAS